MWKAVRVYYYEDMQESLLLDGIRPVLQRIQAEGQVIRAYVQRRWNLGPHIAIHVEVDHEASFDRALHVLRRRIGSYLKKYPSTKQLDQRSYKDLFSKWSTPERDPKSIELIAPNNSIVASELHIANEWYDNEAIVELLHSFYAYTHELILSEIERSRSNSRFRLLQMLRMMAVNGGYDLQEALLRGHLSPRAKVNQYISNLPERDFVQEQYEAADAQLGRTVDEVVQELILHTTKDGLYVGEDVILRRWSAARKELYNAICKLSEVGVIPNQLASYERYGHKFSALQVLNDSVVALMPLFHINRHEQFMLKFLLARSMERVENQGIHAGCRMPVTIRTTASFAQ
ncbi:lantibiotic dehydratase C-terminal domain-containing protein [Paenibacillus taiwanensis]|uniref:lantibiotic dehydratase C-terminal domain-containing protein n=1 Tax=Paenibacillus taiwanensis TaxID=401638 RepID=UPI00040D6774|nr:lantibiotic dehydratase C-terminal domain-containing protein [Paenibacillus taiwanensis]